MSVSVATPTSSSSSPASMTMVETVTAPRPIYPSNLEPGKANLAAFLSPNTGIPVPVCWQLHGRRHQYGSNDRRVQQDGRR